MARPRPHRLVRRPQGARSLRWRWRMAGFCPLDEVVTLRKLGSPFQGHPHWLKLPGVEVSSGSLGQGLSIAVGMALAARSDGKQHKIFCLMGDGEQQEGQVWEAAMEAGHFHLDNIIAVIDCNRLQIDGWVKDVMQVEPLAEKYASFGWDVLRTDGHDMSSWSTLSRRPKRAVGKPAVILADTIKGKGVSFMENQPGWHGKAPNREELAAALASSALPNAFRLAACSTRQRPTRRKSTAELAAKMPKFSPRLLVERGRHHEGENGAHAQGLRQVAGRQWRRRTRGLPWARHLRFNHHQRFLCRQAGARRSAGSAWASRSNRPPPRLRAWRGKASCRCSAPTQHSPRRAISIRFASPSATATSTC